MKLFDAIIPIGADCHTAPTLTACRLKNEAMPFDNVGAALINKCGKGGLERKVELICNHFLDFFNLEDLVSRGANPETIDYWNLWIVNKRTGLSFRHDFPADKDIKDSYPAIAEKYQKTIDRLYEIINLSDNVLFLFIAKIEGYDDKYLIEQKIKLERAFPNKKIEFLYLMHKADFDPCKFVEREIYDGVMRVDANMTYTEATDIRGKALGNTKLYYAYLEKYYSPVRFSYAENQLNLLRNAFKNYHFPELHKRFLRIEKIVFSYGIKNLIEQKEIAQQCEKEVLSVIISAHPIYYTFKKWHYFIKAVFHRGERRKYYYTKYRSVRNLLKASKKS